MNTHRDGRSDKNPIMRCDQCQALLWSTSPMNRRRGIKQTDAPSILSLEKLDPNFRNPSPRIETAKRLKSPTSPSSSGFRSAINSLGSSPLTPRSLVIRKAAVFASQTYTEEAMALLASDGEDELSSSLVLVKLATAPESTSDLSSEVEIGTAWLDPFADALSVSSSSADTEHSAVIQPSTTDACPPRLSVLQRKPSKGVTTLNLKPIAIPPLSEDTLKAFAPSSPSASRPHEASRQLPTTAVRSWHTWHWASGEADSSSSDPEQLTPLQQLALHGDVAHVLARVCQLSRSGWRAAVTQGGLGDGIFYGPIEGPLRVACVAALEPRTLHALFQGEGRKGEEEEDEEEEEGAEEEEDTSYWEPHRARSTCVDCSTRLIRRSHCRCCGRCTCRLCGQRNRSTPRAEEVYGARSKFCLACTQAHHEIHAALVTLVLDYGDDFLLGLSPLDRLCALYCVLGGERTTTFDLPPPQFVKKAAAAGVEKMLPSRRGARSRSSSDDGSVGGGSEGVQGAKRLIQRFKGLLRSWSRS